MSKKALSAAVESKIRLAYISGMTPREIAFKFKRSGIASSKQVRDLASRRGWLVERNATENVVAQSAQQVLAQVRDEHRQELRQVLGDVFADTVADADRLGGEQGWSLVTDAAGASSLQRAKTLHVNRLLQLHGLDAPTEQPQQVTGIALIFGNPLTPEQMSQATDTTATSTANATDI
ncbi:hypothetical protein [Nibricoccus sp. IMCC34717]|uniref:hypothetical protein n=1 Tax=Nibricoccus sp. IMCC34717 TaxID=3034021 RepID=UPI00384E920F